MSTPQNSTHTSLYIYTINKDWMDKWRPIMAFISTLPITFSYFYHICKYISIRYKLFDIPIAYNFLSNLSIFSKCETKYDVFLHILILAIHWGCKVFLSTIICDLVKKCDDSVQILCPLSPCPPWLSSGLLTSQNT